MGHYCEDCSKDVAHCVCPPLPVAKDILTEQDHAGLAKAFNDMQAKMRVTAAKGRSGWYDPALCPAGRLRLMLRNAVRKGDAVDVMNLAMMLNARGEPTHVHGEEFSNLYNENEWYEAVADACDVVHLRPFLDNPRGTLNALLNANVKIALDPAVSKDARELMRKGEAEAGEKMKMSLLGDLTTNQSLGLPNWWDDEDFPSKDWDRKEVPGGWLVTYKKSVTFVPDPTHSWT